MSNVGLVGYLRPLEHMSDYELNAWVRPDGEYRLAWNPKERQQSLRIPDPARLARAEEKRERRRMRNLGSK